jgi:hypothetical protein
MSDSRQVLNSVAALVDAWCEERKLRCLRFILQAFPLTTGITDDWSELALQLRNVETYCVDDLSEEELAQVRALARDAEKNIHRT